MIDILILKNVNIRFSTNVDGEGASMLSKLNSQCNVTARDDRTMTK